MYHQPLGTHRAVGYGKCVVPCAKGQPLRSKETEFPLTCVAFTPKPTLLSSLPFPSSFPSSLSHKHTWKVLTLLTRALQGRKQNPRGFLKDQSYQMFPIGCSNHTSEEELGRTLGKTRNASTNHCLTPCQRASPLRSGTTFLHAGSRNIERPLPDRGLGKSRLRAPL